MRHQNLDSISILLMAAGVFCACASEANDVSTGSAGSGGSAGHAGADVGESSADASTTTAFGGGSGITGSMGGGGTAGMGATAGAGGAATSDAATASKGRDPCKWPFADNSIWNTPIGSGATYVAAGIQQQTQAGMTTDPDLIILKPDAPLTDINTNLAGWSGKDRCPQEGGLVFSAPIPANFTIANSMNNNGAVILATDGHTIKQTQPFSRCTAGSFATSQYKFADTDIMTAGISGAHGGSGMSALGGSLRMGELRPGKSPPRHVLKGNLFAKMNLFRCTTAADCFRWPALTGDNYAVGNYGTGRDGIPHAIRMGALLAILPAATAASLGLETEPAKMVLYTLQNFGMYIVDDTAWDVYALESELGPDGVFTDQFQGDWGFTFTPSSLDTPWARDMGRLFMALQVVDNNAATSVGGGGTPRVTALPSLGAACGTGIGASD